MPHRTLGLQLDALVGVAERTAPIFLHEERSGARGVEAPVPRVKAQYDQTLLGGLGGLSFLKAIRWFATLIDSSLVGRPEGSGSLWGCLCRSLFS